MIDLEVVSIADPAEHRLQDRLVDILDTLAARAHEVMVVFGDARDVCRDVPRSFEPRRHTGLDLGLEGAIDGGEAEARVAAVQAFVQLVS